MASFLDILGSSGTSSAVSGAFGLISNAINNKQQRKLYEQQYQDSIDFYNMQNEDNIEFWNMNNAYNEEMYNKYSSPAAQARQMREAGLNPDLQSVDGGSIADATAPAAAGAEVPRQEYTPISADIFAQLPSLLDIARQINEIDSQDIALSSSFGELLPSLVLPYANEDIVKSIERGDNSFNILPSEFSDRYLSHFNKRRSKRFLQQAESYFNSPEMAATYRQLRKSGAGDKFDFDKILANPLFGNSASLAEFMSMVVENDQAMMKANRSRSNFQSEYFDSAVDAGVPGKQAQAESEQYDVYKSERNTNKQIQERFNEWFTKSINGEGSKMAYFLASAYMVLMQLQGVGISLPKFGFGNDNFRFGD